MFYNKSDIVSFYKTSKEITVTYPKRLCCKLKKYGNVEFQLSWDGDIVTILIKKKIDKPMANSFEFS